ncbi:reverse transcriptase domain-containing protein [Tanacetum coccineum]
MQEGTFLGYKVNTDGLKVCPDKADAILSLPSLRCLKDVQKLNGKLASLNRFLSKSVEKSLPFFKTLKKCTKKGDFQWTQEAEVAFKQMKKLIAKLPMLTAPKEKRGANHVLGRGQGSYQRSLNDRKGRQANAGVLCESRPTRAGDQLHPHGKISVSLAQRKQVVEKILPSTYSSCNHRSADKATVVKLRNQWEDAKVKEESSDELMTEPKTLPEPWTLFTDGSSCVDGSRAGLILTNPEGVEFTYAMRFRFEATNNEAEYKALLTGLRIAEQMGVKKPSNKHGLTACSQPVPRSENKKADALSKIASTSFAHLSKQVLVEELKEKSINEKEVLDVVEEDGHTWMTPICEYLTKEILLEDKKKARVVRRKASRYAVINGTLYKKSFLGPWLRCVRPLQANYVLREIHEGSCSMHSVPRSVIAKAIRTGYYWPTMHADARKLIRECNNCQGIDIAGPFPEGPGKVNFLIMVIDYFTKWIEAKPVATITGKQVKKFVWDNIVCRFGLPGEIVSDNGKQFCENPFKDWCEKLCIRQCFASVKHPQTNGLVERANRSLGEGIKARLDERSKDWMGELSHVL